MSTSDTARRLLTTRRVESVPVGARVRHVDELDERALERFYRLVRTGTAAVAEDCEFADGDVIVFTDYYRVDVS